MSVKSNFQYGDMKVNMELGYRIAEKLEDLGLDVLSIIAEPSIMYTILVDDRMLLKIWYYYVKEATADSWDVAIDNLDATEGGLNNFREKFVNLVINFSAPSSQPMLKEQWKLMKEELTNSQKLRSKLLSLSSKEEPESTPEITP